MAEEIDWHWLSKRANYWTVAISLVLFTNLYPAYPSSCLHSLDGVRVFVYSQWLSPFNHTKLPIPGALQEFFPADSHSLEVFASRPLDQAVEIAVGKTVTHLAEFRMLPTHQMKMIDLASAEIEHAGVGSHGLISATFHRSTDGTRVFNYGKWESEEAFRAILSKKGFNPDEPYWAGIAKNEFHLYHPVLQFSKDE